MIAVRYKCDVGHFEGDGDDLGRLLCRYGTLR